MSTTMKFEHFISIEGNKAALEREQGLYLAYTLGIERTHRHSLL